jgi:hypothetical protein
VHVFDGDIIVLRWDKSGMHGFELQTGNQRASAVRTPCSCGFTDITAVCTAMLCNLAPALAVCRLLMAQWSRHQSAAALRQTAG